MHDLPSAQAEDPIIVHCPPPRSMARALFKIFAALFVLAFLSIGGIILSVVTGSIDKTLSSQRSRRWRRRSARTTARVSVPLPSVFTGLRLAQVAEDVTSSRKNPVSISAARGQSAWRSIRSRSLTAASRWKASKPTGMELDTALLPKGNGF